MLSIENIRRNPAQSQLALSRRGENPPIERILALDENRRGLIATGDALRAKRNEVSKTIGRLKGTQPDLITEMRQVGDQIAALERDLGQVQGQLDCILRILPNYPEEEVPDGSGESDNRVVREWSGNQGSNSDAIPHWEIGEDLGIIDFERGVKLSGSRFHVLMGQGATLERALISFMMDIHTREHGYTETQVPTIVRRDVMVGSGNLPKFSDNLYHDSEDDLWLIPTAEVPLTNLHRDEVLQSKILPLNYVASTPCFRREKAAAGRDTRGIKRVHQFSKVELYKFVEPESSNLELQKLVSDVERICKLLELPYRVLELCAPELGFASAKSYDLEVWAPGCQEWLEVSSCPNCTDFQARRANVRYKPNGSRSPTYLHTLNGSGLALPRVLIAILELGRMPDGSIRIPEVLHKYTGFDTIEPQ